MARCRRSAQVWFHGDAVFSELLVVRFYRCGFNARRGNISIGNLFSISVSDAVVYYNRDIFRINWLRAAVFLAQMPAVLLRITFAQLSFHPGAGVRHFG